MIHARSRFCILNRNRNGSSATNRKTQLNEFARLPDTMPSCMMNRSQPPPLVRSVGLAFSYWPRDRAWKNPSTVRG